MTTISSAKENPAVSLAYFFAVPVMALLNCLKSEHPLFYDYANFVPCQLHPAFRQSNQPPHQVKIKDRRLMPVWTGVKKKINPPSKYKKKLHFTGCVVIRF
jgi:hypothetical protein